MVVYICSKLRGNIEENQEKAKQYCRQVVDEGNLPIAPHIYFTQFMDDSNVEDRIKALEMNNYQGTVVTIFADDNKKYVSTDLMNNEPVKENFISTDVELIDISFLS